MKKNYFYFLIVILFANQFSYSQNYRVGVKAGVNSCGLYGPDVPTSYSNELGYSGGFYLDTRIAEFLSTQIELNYVRYEFNFSEGIPLVENSLLTVEEKNNFITVPALLRYKRGYEFIFYYINVGAQFSLLLNNNRTSTLFINDLEVDSEYYYGYKHTRYDYGLVAGVGIQVKAVNIDLKYYFSTRNMYTVEDAREMRYNILSLDMSYQFNYKDTYFFGRKTGWKGLKYKIKHLFK